MAFKNTFATAKLTGMFVINCSALILISVKVLMVSVNKHESHLIILTEALTIVPLESYHKC